MKSVATTKMSSKGQVVIPETIRKELGLKTGSQFVVVGKDDVVILKAIKIPPLNEFDQLIFKAREKAAMYGIEKSDINDVINAVRATP